jgi:hypothetical protein
MLAAGASTTVTVSINATSDSLTAGNYSDAVSFVNVTTGNGNTTRSISLTVETEATPGQLDVTPADDLSSTGTAGGPFIPSSSGYILENTGSSSLNWTASNTQHWVSLSATSGTLAPGAASTVTVSINANANSLTVGSYSDTVSFVNITTGNGNTSRTVGLTVNAPGQLEVSPADGLNASGTEGGPFSPDSITYTLSNTGEIALDWSASLTTNWLDLSATSGSLAAGASTTITAFLNANAEALEVGSYQDTVLFIDANSPTTSVARSVALEVIPIVLSLTEISSTGHLQITLVGQPYQTYVIEASSNLLQWSGIETNIAGADGSLAYEDMDDAGTSHRFYRGRTAP